MPRRKEKARDQNGRVRLWNFKYWCRMISVMDMRSNNSCAEGTRKEIGINTLGKERNAMQCNADNRFEITYSALYYYKNRCQYKIQIHCQSKLLEWQGVYDKRMQTLQNRFASIHENIEAQKSHTNKKPKEEANFPIPFCTETNQATDDFATQSSEGGGRKGAHMHLRLPSARLSSPPLCRVSLPQSLYLAKNIKHERIFRARRCVQIQSEKTLECFMHV